MKNNQSINKINYLRWFIVVALIFILIIDLFVNKTLPSFFHFFIVVILLIFGVADRFKVIKIPGFIELKNKTETMDQKLNTVINKVQQIQSQGVNVYFNPQSQTETSKYIEQKSSKTGTISKK